MSDETASSPENSEKPAAAPRVRRVSTPRPKKVAKAAPAEEAPAPVVAEIASIPFPSSPAPVPAPEREREEQTEKPGQSEADWPEPEAASTGGNGPQSESNKRKRRRRKGKGQNAAQQNAAGPVSEEVVLPLVAPEVKSTEASQDQRPRQNPPSQSHQQQQPHQPQRPKVDPELLTKMAWKIYLAEVSEEGVALIGDNDAKDLSRRCFRLAEIFIEEQSRRR